MKTVVRVALFATACSGLFAAPVTWYLNNVTFTDGGRAFGAFTFDSATGAYTNVNVQTTPAPSTSTAGSAVGGGTYTSLVAPSAVGPVVFAGGGVGANIRRFQILSSASALATPGMAVALAGNEGLCDPAACTNLVGSVNRSIAGGQVVSMVVNAPVTWYLSATLADGSQVIGSFDFDASSTSYANVDVAVTPGTTFASAARLRVSRTSAETATDAIFQADQIVQPGTRVFAMKAPSTLASAVPGTVLALAPGASYQDACPPGTTPTCPNNTPQAVLFGTLRNTQPPQYTKVLSQIADGGGWQTSVTLTNLTDSPAPYAITFSQDDGSPFAVAGIGSWTAGTIPPGGVTYLTSTNPATLTQGSAKVMGGQNISVQTIFTQKSANAGGDQQGSVPGDAQGSVSFSAPFDNTNGAVCGFAMTNTSPTSTTVLAIAYDESGRILMEDQTLTLPAGGHTAFEFRNRPGYSTLVGRRGVLRVFAIHPGATPPYPGLNGLLLKFLPNNSFTTIGVTNQ